MKFKQEYILKAHKHSSLHRNEILNSKICGCFYCTKTATPSQILEWTDMDSSVGKTALCPHCGIDSLIGSASGYPVDNPDFLTAMHKYWF